MCAGYSQAVEGRVVSVFPAEGLLEREGSREKERGSLQTSCDCCPCLQPGDGAVAVDELQDNKKLKVGAVWILPARALRGLRGQPQTQGTALLMLGILGRALAWHTPGLPPG